MKIAWHYWCGRSEVKCKGDRYVKYLLISVNSLMKNGGVEAKDIYVTIDNRFLNETKYGKFIQTLGVNLLSPPPYENYSKQIAYYNLLKLYPDLDRIAQIDCDTYVKLPNANEVVQNLTGPISMDVAGGNTTYNLIKGRDGQRFVENECFGVFSEKTSKAKSSGDPSRFACFKDFLQINLDIDLDNLLEKSKEHGAPCGYFYVLHPKALPKGFFEFLTIFNFFFQDDEMGITFAETHFGIDMPLEVRREVRPITRQGKTLEDFDVEEEKILHFPSKDDDLDDYMTKWADSILS